MDDNDEHFAEALAVGDRLVRELCQDLPNATGLLREHEEDHEEILATLFLNDAGDWYIEAWLAREVDPDDFAEAQQLATRIDARLSAASATEQTMIVTGFVEALPNVGDRGRGVVATLPNLLRQERERMD